MRRNEWFVCVATAVVIFTGSGSEGQAFHSGGTGKCQVCHSMQNVLGEQVTMNPTEPKVSSDERHAHIVASDYNQIAETKNLTTPMGTYPLRNYPAYQRTLCKKCHAKD